MSEPDTDPSPPSVAVPEYRATRRWNIVWVVPILALLIGGWLIWRNLGSQGPVALVRFDTADGIEARETQVRCRSVRVGYVKDVKLSEDLSNVTVHLELDPDSEGLLRTGTRFWVVRPRVSASEVSGLGTLLKGNYIELDPGPAGEKPETNYIGLETPPATNRSIPGRRLTLVADEAGSLTAGAPIYYRGFEVGRIESRLLDLGGQRVTYNAFIREEYGTAVRENTRFWNSSGIDVNASASGFKLRTPSLQAMVVGGVSFGTPPDMSPGEPVKDGATFPLFRDEDDATRSAFNPSTKFLLLFDQSVRGLVKGAPVEFRGIPIGRVADISFDYLQTDGDSRIPVLVEVDLTLLRREAAGKTGRPDQEFLKEAVGNGLRASLKTASLITGALYVDVDYYREVIPATLVQVGEYSSFPTISSGFAQLETKITAFLDKIQALPLDDTMKKIGSAADEAATTVAEARGALKEIEETVAAVRKTLDSPEFTELPADLRNTLASLEKSVSSVGPDGAIQGDLLRTLDELRASLRSLKTLTNGLDENPKSLIFGRDSSGNPVPKAPKR